MKYLKSLGLFISSFLLINIIITILSYFEIISPNIIYILKIITIILSSIISGLYLGIKSNKKGYLEGLKLGGIITLLFIIITLIIKPINFTKFSIIYYLVIISIIVVSSMIGINKKKVK